MFILLVENDPFVRIDLGEALECFAPNGIIESYGHLHSVPETQTRYDLIVIDTPNADVAQNTHAMSWLKAAELVVFTRGRGAELADTYPNAQVLQRPFTEQIFLDTLRAGLSKPRSIPNS